MLKALKIVKIYYSVAIPSRSDCKLYTVPPRIYLHSLKAKIKKKKLVQKLLYKPKKITNLYNF